MSMVVLAVIALALFVKQALLSLWVWLASLFHSFKQWLWPTSSFRARARAKAKGERWCQSCRVYHPVSPVLYTKENKEVKEKDKEGKEGDEEGTFWEEGGRYYFLQGSTKHDVTTIVHDRYWRANATNSMRDSPDNACHFCRAHSRLDSHSPRMIHITYVYWLYHSNSVTETHQEEHDKALANKAKKKPPTNTNNNGNNRKANKKKKH